MLEVSASEIVTADKMRGVGPANIIFTAGPNPVAEDRRGVAKVTAVPILILQPVLLTQAYQMWITSTLDGVSSGLLPNNR